MKWPITYGRLREMREVPGIMSGKFIWRRGIYETKLFDPVGTFDPGWKRYG
jgi:hypothetical protein